MTFWKTAAAVVGVVLVMRALRPSSGLGNIFNSRSFAASQANKGNMGLARRQEERRQEQQRTMPRPAPRAPQQMHANFRQPIHMVGRGGWR